MKTARFQILGVPAVVVLLVLGAWLTPSVRAQVAGESQPSGESQASEELKTVAVVAVARYEKLISDIGALGAIIGRPEAGQMVEGGFTFLTQGKGPNALDKKKPWGVIVQTDGANFLPVACLPVNNLQDLLDVAAAYGAQVQDAGDGIKQLVLPNQQSVFVKQESGWVFASLSPDVLSRLPEDPQASLAELVTEYDVAARISVKDVPEMFRQFAVHAIQAGMQEQIQRREEETDEQYELRQKITEAQMAQTMRTLNETDSITIGWAIDLPGERTYVDYTQLFEPDSKMSRQIEAYGQPRTNFAGFYQPDAAVTMSFVTKADPELIREDLQYLETTIDSLRAAVNNAIDEGEATDSEALKAALSDWFDALEATIQAGEFDGGATLDVDADSLTLLVGAHVKDTAKVESGLKKLEAAAAKSPDFPGIEWNAATHAGVKFHTFTLPVPEEHAAPRQLLGEEVDVAVGIGEDAVYVAVGEENLAAVQRAIDASAAERGKAVPPFELVLSLTPIMELAAAQAGEGDQKPIAERMAEMLRNEAQGRDHIRAVGQLVPSGLRYRFEAEEGVLRALGTAANEAQRQALQAQQ